MSAGKAFLWWGAGGSEGIAGSLEAACARVAGSSGAGRLWLGGTIREARPALDDALEEMWVPTGRAWAGHPGAGGVVWEEMAAPSLG